MSSKYSSVDSMIDILERLLEQVNLVLQVETDSITFMFIVYRYDSTTGTFTVPSGGDGYYYFSTYLLGFYSEYSYFDIEINGEILCSVLLEQQINTGDLLQSACSAATFIQQGISGRLL